MGLLFNTSEDLDKKVREKFGDHNAYLVVFKHNSPAKGLGKLLLSSGYYVFDSNRTFLLYFDPKGVYESEIYNTDKKDFVFMAWNEIEHFELVEGNKKILKRYRLRRILQSHPELHCNVFRIY